MKNVNEKLIGYLEGLGDVCCPIYRTNTILVAKDRIQMSASLSLRNKDDINKLQEWVKEGHEELHNAKERYHQQ